MHNPVKPLWLMADSSPFFHGPKGPTWFADELERRGYRLDRAFYAGHANDHQAAHFAIFTAAMAPVVSETACRQLIKNGDWDQNWRVGDLLLLAGGDPRKLATPETRAAVTRALQQGVLIIGISAGAIFLGRAWEEATPMLGTVPYVIDAHQEDTNWQRLRALGSLPLLGLPWRSVVEWDAASGLGSLYGPVPWMGPSP
ncbi:hypothetical protein [Acanthopleuribacter pedis]|uniref:Peptidase n=1 Tax=Acanthopleuribacter pedis TaxID=442870 RepID=A0A8J7QBG2_9BACT|nr:hypothetical protein [Acanthopleuribacter pedis]MBO1320614.1 hypothetical protein [Acanthopleuribacter pedis]